MALFVVAALLSLAATPLLVRYARTRGLIDRPDPRRLHAGEVARGGGAAMVASFLAGSAAAAWLVPGPAGQALPLACGLYVVMLGGLGFWDDHRHIAARWRATVQLAATAALLLALPLPFSGVPAVLTLGLGTMVIVWWINLYNFMDGSNGMATVQALFMGLVVSWLSASHPAGHDGADLAGICGLLTAGAAAGFLPWNFPRPRVFMGDVGSYGLAAMLTAAALLGLRQGSLQLTEVALLPALFVVDASLTLLRRVAGGRRWYDAHREHVYQRLAASGAGATGVLVIYTLVNAGFILPALLWQRRYQEYGAGVVLGVYGILVAAWLIVSRALDSRQVK